MTDVESGKDVGKKDQATCESKQKPSAPLTSNIRAYAGIISFFKYFGGGFFVWSVGRWEFNYGWLLSSIAIYTLYKCYKKDKKLGIEQKPEIIDANDTARMKDLPNWVSITQLLQIESNYTKSRIFCLFSCAFLVIFVCFSCTNTFLHGLIVIVNTEVNTT